jgi:hypothetical protein
MASKREEEEAIKRLLEQEQNPYSWGTGKWLLLTLTVIIVLGFFLG